MAKNHNQAILESHTGRSAAQKAKWRVKRALPEYFQWPRRLRRLYIMLSTHGSTDAAIKATCEEFGWNWDETWEMIAGEHNFLERLIEYRDTKQYPKLKQWANPLSYEHLSIVYAEESRFDQMLHLEDQKASGQGGAHARRMVEDAGFFQETEMVGQKPQIALDKGERVPGMVVDRETQEGFVASRNEASLTEDWDSYDGEPDATVEEYKTSPYSEVEATIEEGTDGVSPASETVGDAPVESAGEVDSSRT